jgi:hypothetical protein
VTHEPELTELVDLCREDGTLNPTALGWSRRPLHRANLGARSGRNKRWDYWAILAGDLVISFVYSDVDYVGLGDIFWADLVEGRSGGKVIVTANGEGFALPELCASEPLRVNRDGLSMQIVDDPLGTTVEVTWQESNGVDGRLVANIALPAGHESLNVVIPWDDTTFNFTSKHQARPAHGVLEIGDRRYRFGADAGDAWGVLDVGRGRWPHDIVWNWGGGAGRVGQHIVGLQFGARWTQGSGFTENGVFVDGRLSKIGNELNWSYDWDHPLEPWRIVDPDGQLDVTLVPRYDKHTDMMSDDRGSEVHQVFGTYFGFIVSDSGERIEFDNLYGFAEEARQRW